MYGNGARGNPNPGHGMPPSRSAQHAPQIVGGTPVPDDFDGDFDADSASVLVASARDAGKAVTGGIVYAALGLNDNISAYGAGDMDAETVYTTQVAANPFGFAPFAAAPAPAQASAPQPAAAPPPPRAAPSYPLAMQQQQQHQQVQQVQMQRRPARAESDTSSDDENEDKRSIVSIGEQWSQYTVPPQLMTHERTLSIFGGSSNLDPAALGRALFGKDYCAPRGIHQAHMVTFSMRLTRAKPVWMVNVPELGSATHALQVALAGAHARQPSLDISARTPDNKKPVYAGMCAGARTTFDVHNAVLLCSALDQAAHVHGGVSVGVRVGLYTDPAIDATVLRRGKPPVPKLEEIAANFQNYARAVHVGGDAYSFVVHPNHPGVAHAPPRRLGAPEYTAWTPLFENLNDDRTEEEFWEGVRVPEDSNDQWSKVRFVQEGDPVVVTLPAADCTEYRWEATRPSTYADPAPVNGTPVYAPGPSQLRDAYVRLLSFHRRHATSQTAESAKARERLRETVSVARHRTVWLVQPQNRSEWLSTRSHPRGFDPEDLGVRTLTEGEMAVVCTMYATMSGNHPAVRLLERHARALRSRAPAQQQQQQQPQPPLYVSGPNGTVRVRFVDLVYVVNEHLGRLKLQNHKRQTRDVTRLTVSSTALFGEKNIDDDYAIDATVSFVVAPMELALGPDVKPSSATNASAHNDGRQAQTLEGRTRLVIPLTLRYAFLRAPAWDRARGAESETG